MSLPERSTLGRYRIIRRLGAGAMGEVYLAEDPHIDRQLALKTVRLGDGGAIEIEERRVRLMREAKAAGKLVHPYVVALFDAGEADDGVFYLAFEYVGGPDLAARQRVQPPLTLGEVLRIGREAAEGLDAAHRQGIVHRDIKPSNIMLDISGQVKIGDFGIAKMLGQATELTQTGSVVGSPHYLSPEQVRGEELDGRSDLFSLGVVLYELLTRTRPFAGETITTLVYQILAREPLPIVGMRPGLPERVERVVTKLLQKDREQRFASGRELADELAACERELPPEVLASPAAVVPDEMGDTVRMSSSGAVGLPPLPPPGGPAPPAAGGGSQGTPGGQPAMEGTAPTRAWSPSGASATGGVGAPPPLGASGALAAAGAAVPGSGSYGPATAPRRFPWGIVAVLAVVALLGAGFLVGGLLWLRNGGLQRGAGEQVAAGGSPDELATVPASAPLPVLPAGGEPPAPQPPAATDSATVAEPMEVASRETPAAPAPVPAPPVEEPRQPSQRQPEPRRETAPATAPAPPRPAPTQAAPVRRAEPAPAPPPSRPEAAPEPEPDPEPEPEDDQRFDRELQSSLSVKFAVQPPEAVVSVKREGDRRFTVIGRAGDYDAGKKKLPAYDLNGPGVHYVRIVHEGREVIYRLEAQLGAQVTTITANLAPAGPRRR
jgi:hypothetical protein